jgi:hypothetical protein
LFHYIQNYFAIAPRIPASFRIRRHRPAHHWNVRFGRHLRKSSCLCLLNFWIIKIHDQMFSSSRLMTIKCIPTFFECFFADLKFELLNELFSARFERGSGYSSQNKFSYIR